MKTKLLVASILIIIIVLFGCYKDELGISSNTPSPTFKKEFQEVILDDIVDNQQARSGQRDLILFRQSLSTDNYLLTIDGSVPRTHTVYNKNKVAYLQFAYGLNDPINYGGVNYKHYKILVMYKDSTYDKLVAYSKDTVNIFKFIPQGDNLLFDGHPSKYVSWTRSSRARSSINEWRGASLINIPQWNIKFDTVTMVNDYRYPRTKHSNLFQPPHSN